MAVYQFFYQDPSFQEACHKFLNPSMQQILCYLPYQHDLKYQLYNETWFPWQIMQVQWKILQKNL